MATDLTEVHMKKLPKLLNIAALGFAALALTPSVLAQEQVDKIVSTSQNPYIRITHINGEIEVKTWENAEVQVTGTLGEHADEFIFEGDDRRVTIEVKAKKSKGWYNWNRGYDESSNDDLLIMVPVGSEINYDSINGSISVSGTTGGVDVDVINGKVEVTDASGRMRLNTVNGPIRIDNTTGDLDLGTVNGSIKVQHASTDDVNLETVNGDIKLTSQAFDVNVETVNGDIKLALGEVERLNIDTVNSKVGVTLALLPTGKIDASSVDANMNFTFTNDVAARFELEGHAGGNFTNKLTGDRTEKAKYGPGRWLNFTTNNGSAKVSIETVSGRVTLDKQ